MSETIHIEIAYALPQEQILLTRQLASGTTAEQAIRDSGLLAKHPEIDLGKNKIGIS